MVHILMFVYALIFSNFIFLVEANMVVLGCVSDDDCPKVPLPRFLKCIANLCCLVRKKDLWCLSTHKSVTIMCNNNYVNSKHKVWFLYNNVKTFTFYFKTWFMFVWPFHFHDNLKSVLWYYSHVFLPLFLNNIIKTTS